VVQITDRDEAMLDWLSVVRVADTDAVRWALGAFDGAGEPVGARRAQQWIARLAGVGLLERARPVFQDRSIVWATHLAVGKTAPNIFRQTTRHEVAVAAVSARYLVRGYSWRRDRKPAGLRDHQADGVALRGDMVELVEVELTPKTLNRYRLICENHSGRLSSGTVSRVAYFCTPDAARCVSREADKFIFRTERAGLVTHDVFDVNGKWAGDENTPWAEGLVPPVRVPELDGWDRLGQSSP
jgi:hypothetical protein